MEYLGDLKTFWQADNDFPTTSGVVIDKPYNYGMNVENQALVWRVTLPAVDGGAIEKSKASSQVLLMFNNLLLLC